jgi:hypothetical protein
MTLEEKILDIWEGNAAAIALVPASQFKTPGNYERRVRPYVDQYPIAERSIHVHNGGGTIQRLRIWEVWQMSIVADSYSSAKAVAEKMRSLFNGNIDGVQFFYLDQHWVGSEDEQGVGAMVVQFKIAETLTT